MAVMQKLFGKNAGLFSSLVQTNQKKRLLWSRLVEKNITSSEQKQLALLIEKEIHILEGIQKLNQEPLKIKWWIVRKILNNLKQYHNDEEKGIVYDTSNLRFIKYYRSDSAIKAAKMLRTRMIRHLPDYLRAFEKAGFSEKDIFRARFFQIDRIFYFLDKIRKNSIHQRYLLKVKRVNPAWLWRARFKEQAYFHLIKHYLTAAVRRTVIRVKVLSAVKRLEEIRKTPRKSLFFVFGGMEDRYLPLIGEMIKKLGDIFVLKVHKIDNFLYYVRLKDHDLYFAICIGASSRYYPSYYYLPSANDLVKFIRRYVGKRNVERLLLFGVCGSFRDKRGTIYLPKSYSALFYKFEKKVKVESLGMIQRRKIQVKNFFTELVKGKEVDIFTCSTIFNHAVVGMEEVTYQQLKSQVSDKKSLRSIVEKYKLEEFMKCARLIAKKDLADGVEMESYMFAKHFRNKFGCYLEVSDNILKKDDVSFDMEEFTKRVNANFERLIKRTIALMWL